jgi:CHRD domain
VDESHQEEMMDARYALARVIACAFAAVGIAGCGGGGGYSSGTPANPVMVVRSASLTGGQEVPPVPTAATGRGALIVHPTTYEIMGGGVTFTGLSGAPTGAHIHRADGSIVTGLTLASGTATDTATLPAGTPPLSAADQAQLLAGTLYFNVHTGANPNGEIRGAISGSTGVTAGLATLNGASEVPPNPSTATGRGMIVFDSITRTILISYVTHNVTAANNAHIHSGAPGAIGGPIVALFSAGATTYFAQHGVVLSAPDAASLSAGNTYFNVHSPTYVDGEIRGQIAVQ